MKNYNYASIDIGSNSINLLLAYVNNGVILEEETISYVTGLGKGLSNTGKFSEEGMLKAENAFKDIRHLIDSFHIPANQIICVGTEASRKSKNSHEFLGKIFHDYNIKTNIISPEKEATFSLTGVIHDNLDEALILDLGGASTELIYVKKQKIEKFFSFEIGSVNQSINFHEDQIFDFIQHFNFRDNIYLVGGTAATLATCLLKMTQFKDGEINSAKFTLEQLNQFYDYSKNLELEKLISLYPLTESRKQSFLDGVEKILKFLNIIKPKEIFISTKGVRHGALMGLLSVSS